MSRLAGEGRAAWAETSCTGPVLSAKDQPQPKNTPAGRPESINGSWQRDLAGQVGSIELLGGVLKRIIKTLLSLVEIRSGEHDAVCRGVKRYGEGDRGSCVGGGYCHDKFHGAG